MKWISLIVVLGLGIAAILLPNPAAPEPGNSPGRNTPPVAICSVDESSIRATFLDVASTVAGPGAVTVFAGGDAAGDSEFSTGSSGSTSVSILDIAAIGQAAALVELPSSDSAVASILTGEEIAAGEICSQIPDQQVVIGGGSTIDDRDLEVQLMNPYADEAVVDIRATSESGRETNEGLNSITVPPRTSVVVDIDNLLPGREQLVLSVETSRGSVVAVARSNVARDAAIWRAVAPAENWYAVLPTFGGQREVVIASAGVAGVEYQIDIYGPGGFEEAAIEGTVGAGGQEVIDVSAISEAPVALHVVATGAVAVFTRLTSNNGLALTAGSPIEAATWLLPGAGSITDSRGRLVMVNVGLETADVTVTELREQSRSRVFTVDSGQVIEVDLDENPSNGVTLTSDGLFVPMWVMRTGPGVAISGGVPLLNE